MEAKGFILALTVSGYFSVCANKEEEVLCVHWKPCVLPCRFTPRNKTPNETLILWTKKESDVVVLNFYDGLSWYDWDPYLAYRGRIYLVEEDMKLGNASLLLREVTIKDEGRYVCLANDQVTYVNMKVHAPVSKVYMNLRHKELICRAYRVYPRPEVKWSPEPSSDPVTSIDPSKEGWFSVFSSVPLPLMPLHQYSCNVSTAHSWKSETYRTNNEADESLWFWLPPLLLGLILLAGCAVVVWIMRRRRQHIQLKSEETSEKNKDASGEPSAGSDDPEEEHLKPNHPEATER